MKVNTYLYPVKAYTVSYHGTQRMCPVFGTRKEAEDYAERCNEDVKGNRFLKESDEFYATQVVGPFESTCNRKANCGCDPSCRNCLIAPKGVTVKYRNHNFKNENKYATMLKTYFSYLNENDLIALDLTQEQVVMIKTSIDLLVNRTQGWLKYNE